MREVFKKIPVIIPEPKLDDYKNKRQMVLTYIGAKCHINKIIVKPYPIKRPILSKEAKKYDIK